MAAARRSRSLDRTLRRRPPSSSRGGGGDDPIELDTLNDHDDEDRDERGRATRAGRPLAGPQGDGAAKDDPGPCDDASDASDGLHAATELEDDLVFVRCLSDPGQTALNADLTRCSEGGRMRRTSTS